MFKVFNFAPLLVVYKLNYGSESYAKLMKKCPQCGKVFDDSLRFCTQDGTPLVADGFAPPSEFSGSSDTEEETVIHHEPIIVDFSEPPPAPEEAIHQTPPQIVTPIVIEKRRNTGKYLLFLIIGLILGGSLVLATLLLARQFYQGNDSQIAAQSNENAANNSPNRPQKTPTATPTPFPLNSEHQTRTSTDDEDFNGRVIASTAYIRSSPSRDAAPADLLPKDDRLSIERRAGDNSPWYYVSCEHGSKGWMHGDTIEFTKDAF